MSRWFFPPLTHHFVYTDIRNLDIDDRVDINTNGKLKNGDVVESVDPRNDAKMNDVIDDILSVDQSNLIADCVVVAQELNG